MSACCPAPGGEHAALTAVAAELDAELAGDPTLQECCRQDLEDQATAARLRAQLSLKDPSRERQRLAAQVIRAPARGAGSGSDLESDEDGDDTTLGRLRAERLRQLQAAAAHKAALQSQGRGAVTSVPEDRLLDAAERCGGPAVCHLAVEGSAECDALDEHLGLLAHRYLGTAFMRTLLPPRSRLHLRLGAPPGPGLACFRGGALVGVLAAYGGGGGQEVGGAMREEEVEAALRALRMLREGGGGGSGAAAATQRPGAQSAASSDAEDEEGEGEGGGGGWCEPCEECGRSYPHQHIRTMYTERGGGSGSSDDGG